MRTCSQKHLHILEPPIRGGPLQLGIEDLYLEKSLDVWLVLAQAVNTSILYRLARQECHDSGPCGTSPISLRMPTGWVQSSDGTEGIEYTRGTRGRLLWAAISIKQGPVKGVRLVLRVRLVKKKLVRWISRCVSMSIVSFLCSAVLCA